MDSGVGGPCGHDDGARHEEEGDELSMGVPQGGHGTDSDCGKGSQTVVVACVCDGGSG